MRYEKERQDIIDCARELERRGLVIFSGGNVSMKAAENEFLVTPSAMDYNTMVPSDVVLVDKDGTVLEGGRRPTSDLKAILYIFNHMPEVRAVIHTHQPWAVAAGLLTDELPVISTTMADELHGPVPAAPFTISSDESMGVQTAEHAGRAPAVLLKHHGAMIFETSLKAALTSAAYLEESCKIYVLAAASGRKVPALTKEQTEAEDAPRGYYGQP